jgi:hypothetical protein
VWRCGRPAGPAAQHTHRPAPEAARVALRPGDRGSLKLILPALLGTVRISWVPAAADGQRRNVGGTRCSPHAHFRQLGHHSACGPAKNSPCAHLGSSRGIG